MAIMLDGRDQFVFTWEDRQWTFQVFVTRLSPWPALVSWPGGQGLSHQDQATLCVTAALYGRYHVKLCCIEDLEAAAHGLKGTLLAWGWTEDEDEVLGSGLSVRLLGLI